MGSITLSEVLRQTRELVSDPEDALYGDLDSAMADAIQCLLERIATVLEVKACRHVCTSTGRFTDGLPERIPQEKGPDRIQDDPRSVSRG